MTAAELVLLWFWWVRVGVTPASQNTLAQDTTDRILGPDTMNRILGSD